MWGVEKTIETVFSYSSLKLQIVFGFSFSNVVPVHLISLARLLTGLKKYKKDLNFAIEYYSFVLFIMRHFLAILH